MSNTISSSQSKLNNHLKTVVLILLSLALVLPSSLFGLSVAYADDGAGTGTATGPAGSGAVSNYYLVWKTQDWENDCLGYPSSADDYMATVNAINGIEYDGQNLLAGEWNPIQLNYLKKATSEAYNECVENYNKRFPDATEECQPRIVAVGLAVNQYDGQPGRPWGLSAGVTPREAASSYLQAWKDYWHLASDNVTYSHNGEVYYNNSDIHTWSSSNSVTLNELATSRLEASYDSGTVLYVIMLDQTQPSQAIGHIDLQKHFSDNSNPDDNDSYDLSEAEYKIYSDYDDAKAKSSNNVIETLHCSKDGFASASQKYKVGDYWVTETKAAKNCELDTRVYKVTITKEQAEKGYVTRVSSTRDGGFGYDPSNPPANIQEEASVYDPKIPGKCYLLKTSANTTITNGNNCYSLEGAKYGVYKTKEEAKASTNDNRGDYAAELTTDKTGKTNTVELEADTYYVKEWVASKGYELCEETHELKVKVNETTNVSCSEKPLNDPILIRINKYDGETSYSKINLPQGSASLAGAQFKVEYFDNLTKTTSGKATKTWIYQTNEEGVIYTANPKQRISGDALFLGDHQQPVFPLGCYKITEIKAPEGYLLNSTWSQVVTVNPTEDGSAKVDVDPTDGVKATEQVKRIGLELQKKNDNNGASIANCVFKISLLDENGEAVESHIAVTNEAGIFDTDLTTANSNANDAAVSEDGTVDETKLDASQGVWFTNSSTPDNAKNPFVYGTYKIEELACAANEGKQLIEPTIFIASQDKSKINLGTFDDTEMDIMTVASDTIDKDKIIVADKDSVIRDTVQYFNATKNRTYTIQTTLVDKTDENKVLASESKSVKLSTAYGKLDVDVAVDTTNLAGHTLAFQTTIQCDGRTLATHNKDLTDENEEVAVVKTTIGTVALDKTSNTNIVAKDSEAVVVDTVNYTNLLPNTEYKISGKIMEIGVEGNATQYVDAKGVEVIAETTFTTGETASGAKEVTFTFDASNINKETKLVVFETLYKNDEEVAKHEDPADENQIVTVYIPDITTDAKDGLDGDKKVTKDTEIVVEDTVTYTNLVPAKEYELQGTLMDKKTGKVLTANGEEVKSEKVKFTPEKANGEEIITFKFDGSGLENGQELVAFEELYRDGNLYAAHADIEDEAQTVITDTPDITTDAKDGLDGDKQITKDTKIVVEDTVTYTNLVPGKEYELQGTLMGKKTGKVLTANGEEVKSEKVKFTPEKASGEEVITFKFDGSGLENGQELVAFEELYRDGNLYAAHADIEDEAQTVIIVYPEIATKATDKTDGDQVILQSTESCVYDIVIYKNLFPGKQYVIQGKLMDKSTGKALVINDKEITATASFTANGANGAQAVEFTFDSTGIKSGTQLVAFEKLFLDEVEIAVHEDINDEAQTVIVEATEPVTPTPTSTPGKYYDKTGADLNGFLPYLVGMMSVLLGTTGIYLIRRYQNNKSKN